MTVKRTAGMTRAAVALAALALVGATTAVSIAAPASPRADGAQAARVVHHQACATPTAHHAACMAVVDTDASGQPLTSTKPDWLDLHPFTAAELQDAYKLPSDLLGARQTVAIVDAFDNPNAEADLAVYRAENGLPPCTTDNGCFRKVDQRGGTDYPTSDVNWGVEIALDLDMASASCPNCSLLLVESDDNVDDNLGQAVNQAVALGATVVSNSYGGAEFSQELDALGAYYTHPGVPILASSGDGGFGVIEPAAMSSVIAVGGTSLFRDNTTERGWNETAWAGAGSGCSANVAKPSWQHDKLCDKRTVADLAVVADPGTPVAVYDTFGYPGWIASGGTSVGAPLVAGIYALAGNSALIDPGPHLYAHRRDLFDVSSGSNGVCGGSYLCNAVPGYDGPTGLGTPNGIGAL